jgi:hypothetical protein
LLRCELFGAADGDAGAAELAVHEPFVGARNVRQHGEPVALGQQANEIADDRREPEPLHDLPDDVPPRGRCDAD